jgi:hypothetical protein
MTDWWTLQASVRGAAHRRAGLPNQDAVHIARANGGLPLIATLADGHGSAKSFRSQHGARSAVAVALEVCGSLFEPDNLSRIKRRAEEQLPLELVRHWRQRVDRSLARRPFAPAELEPLDSASRSQVEAHPYLAYGSTLLAVVVTPAFILYLQLGDGDLLTVSANGEVERPLPKDERLIANETTSLCSDKAWNEVRVKFQALAGAPPALILAATDGYANAFRDEASFQQVARDLWEMLRDEGVETVQSNLKDWLNEASQQGSGDDITVGIMYPMAHESACPRPR